MTTPTHYHLHHHNNDNNNDHHHHVHAKRKHRLASTASACVILTGCMAWFSVLNASQLLLDPRKLMADTEQSSTSSTSQQHHQASLGGAILLRKEPHFGVLEEINVTHAALATQQQTTAKWMNRVVYLLGDESWRTSLAQRAYLIPTYPHVVPPGGERGVNEEDDAETGLMQDFTRWYPQIDSSDESFHIERKGWPVHEIDPDNCHPMHAWQSTSFPVCNTIHEKNIRDSFVEHDLYVLSKKGFWRNAWGSSDLDFGRNETTSNNMVWKTFKIHHSMEDSFFENNRVDALAMERLTASPNVIDIYGFCAMTVIQEFAGGQMHEKQRNPTESLDFAIQVARGIRDIHYIGDSKLPTLVHNDINLANILVTEDDRPVLNDFNIAVLLMKNESSSGTQDAAACPFYGRFPNPQWRSPEEQVDSEEESRDNPPVVNEKIDIYAMGNVLFRLVAGVSPWKRKGATRLFAEDKVEIAFAKRYNGTLPEVPDDVNLENPAMSVLHQAMQMCFRFNPNERPTAKELVDFLENARSRSKRS